LLLRPPDSQNSFRRPPHFHSPEQLGCSEIAFRTGILLPSPAIDSENIRKRECRLQLKETGDPTFVNGNFRAGSIRNSSAREELTSGERY
jgi:hypothetical protein